MRNLVFSKFFKSMASHVKADTVAVHAQGVEVWDYRPFKVEPA